MSGYYLGDLSIDNLKGVHPDMIRVVERAILITAIDFGVTEGLRQDERQVELFNAGKSTTLNSKHKKQRDGFGHAIDLYCRDTDGNVTWSHAWFRWVIQAMMTAAILEGVPIKAGGLWRTFQDSPHFELDDNYYK